MEPAKRCRGPALRSSACSGSPKAANFAASARLSGSRAPLPRPADHHRMPAQRYHRRAAAQHAAGTGLRARPEGEFSWAQQSAGFPLTTGNPARTPGARPAEPVHCAHSQSVYGKGHWLSSRTSGARTTSRRLFPRACRLPASQRSKRRSDYPFERMRGRSSSSHDPFK
jgi:hypothetical protein